MLVLIWAALLFSANSATGGKQTCYHSYCVTLSERAITAEAGLCAVIPCSFTHPTHSKPKHAIWFECGSTCSDEKKIIFNFNNQNISPKKQVALLDSDWATTKNCSIIINDLTWLDTEHTYMFRVTEGRSGFTHSYGTKVTVTDLRQKPTLTSPQLTEGQQTTLTCTAPGRCSGSPPEIIWEWRSGTGENSSHVVGNTSTETVVSQKYSSTLTFTPSATHHGTKVACMVTFLSKFTTNKTLTLDVTYAKTPTITGNTSVKEGEALILTCSADSHPTSHIILTKVDSEEYLQNGTETATLVIPNVTAEHSGQYVCTAQHLNTTLTASTNVTVMYVRMPTITGNTSVKEGEAMTLTCSAESHPPSLITWTKLHSEEYLQNGTETATLVIPNVTAEHSGQYVCTARPLNTTLTASAHVTVMLRPKIQNGSECVVESDVLTCVCISLGVPLPSIKWPLLESQAKYSITTTVSNFTVNSTIVLAAGELDNTAVECVSSSAVTGEVKTNLTIINKTEQEGLYNEVLGFVVTRLETIIAFLIGVVLSAIICCLTRRCCRKKKKNSKNLSETLEMVTSQDQPANVGHEVEEEGRAESGAPSSEAVVRSGVDGGLTDGDYASIDYSLLKKKSPDDPEKKQEVIETEYAEIKKEEKEQIQEDSGEESEMLKKEEENEEEEVGEAVMKEDEETKHPMLEGEGGEDVALYSNVKAILGEKE